MKKRKLLERPVYPVYGLWWRRSTSLRIGRKRNAIPKHAIPPAQQAKKPRNLTDRAISSQLDACQPQIDSVKKRAIQLTVPTATPPSSQLPFIQQRMDKRTHRQSKISFFLLTPAFIPQGYVPTHAIPYSSEWVGRGGRRLWRVILD